jgi:RimJ/RimL family protein N-acetyltransferase
MNGGAKGNSDHDVHFPPALYGSVRIGSVQSKDGQRFTVVAGLDKNAVAQLKRYSLDASDQDLQNNTSDMLRFGESSYEEWYAKDRTPFALVNDAGDLAALAWFGPKPLGRKSLRYLSQEELEKENEQSTGEWHTVVYRSYRPYRGIGLMTPFLRYVIDAYKAQYPAAKLWAGISTNNPASIALAKKLGFKVADEYSDPAAHWCAMIQS